MCVCHSTRVLRHIREDLCGIDFLQVVRKEYQRLGRDSALKVPAYKKGKKSGFCHNGHGISEVVSKVNAKMYTVATPIGNRGDITLRALEILKQVDVIAAEDTRRTGQLLVHFGITGKRLISHHGQNEAESAAGIVGLLAAGQSVALVSDGGTPGISDPGTALVQAAITAGFAVEAVPGACAAITAVSVSGLPTAHFLFYGFLPRKKGDIKRKLETLVNFPFTLVFYEAPSRVRETLEICRDVLGDRPMALCRELTKLHEQTLRGRVSDVLACLSEPLLGECVVVVGGAELAREQVTDADILAEAALLLAQGHSPRDAAAAVALQLKVPKKRVYALCNGLGGE